MNFSNANLQKLLTQFDPELSYGETKAAILAEFERRYIGYLIETYHGNISLAARSVRMDRKHLTDLIRKHQLEEVRYSAAAPNASIRDRRR